MKGLQSSPIKYKGLSENLESGVSNLGNQVRGMPHLYLGSGGISTKPNTPPEEKKPSTNPQVDGFIDKAKNWGFILAISLVVIYAVYRIINSILT